MKLSLALGPGLLGLLVSGFAFEQHPIGGNPPSSAGSIASSSSSPAPADGPSYRSALLDLHKSLVSISSISGTENKVGSFLVEYLTARDYVAQLQFLPPAGNTPHGAERFNVLAWPGPTRNPKPRVLISSHIDVVPPYIPYHIDAEGSHVGPDTLIRGRGSVDAKASVAAQVTALEELLAAQEVDREDAMLLFVVGEETTGDGMKFFSASLDELDPPPKFEAVIFGEPTENRLACGHKGIGMFNIHAQGKAAHSGYPWLGKSATELLMRALVKLLDKDLGSSERFGNTTVNVGVLDGGVAMNVVAKTASASISVRIGVGNQTTGLGIVADQLDQILKEVDDEAFAVDTVGGYGPVVANCDVEGFEKIAVNYGTDVPNLAGDHTRYLYGPGSILVAHGDDEAITVADLETSVEGYKKLIKFALQA
ncbi:Zn-dependent exopeptidase [Thozetella sp. PMI_491]|nr:Zn-dependent exopeptidase [Thozetella sp. PMI_491]